MAFYDFCFYPDTDDDCLEGAASDDGSGSSAFASEAGDLEDLDAGAEDVTSEPLASSSQDLKQPLLAPSSEDTILPVSAADAPLGLLEELLCVVGRSSPATLSQPSQRSGGLDASDAAGQVVGGYNPGDTDASPSAASPAKGPPVKFVELVLPGSAEKNLRSHTGACDDDKLPTAELVSTELPLQNQLLPRKIFAPFVEQTQISSIGGDEGTGEVEA